MKSPLGTFKEGDPFGPYEIRSLIGINTGEVYRAHDPRHGREVVLCVFSPRLSGVALETKKRDLERQLNLARALNNHPNIAAVYELGTWEGWLFIVRELLEGPSLRDHIQGKPLSLATSLNYALQIVTVLEAAHDLGIVHGCLRPSAILVTVDNRIKVLDFALEAASDARNSITIGDPAYMSPEQLRGEDWDRRSDFFAFGAVLYEMLAGMSPFQRDSYLETVNFVLRENPRSLSELNRLVPRSLALLVENCLAKDRGKRPVRARMIAVELERLVLISHD
jgi:eukaryotic-like serine/threonine-protein kinase